MTPKEAISSTVVRGNSTSANAKGSLIIGKISANQRKRS